MSDIVKELKKIRENQEKRKKLDKIAIVCWHILMTATPIKAFIFKRVKIDSKDSGKTYCCDLCVSEFEEKCMKGDSTGYSAIEERKFTKNINDIKEI